MSSAFSPIEPVNEFIEADLNYLVPTGRRPVNYAYPAPPGMPLAPAKFHPSEAAVS